jgi:hypothetical protein
MMVFASTKTLSPCFIRINEVFYFFWWWITVRLSGANDMSGIVAHNLSGLLWSPLEVADETDGDATGDPEDAIRRGLLGMDRKSIESARGGTGIGGM